MEIKKIGVLGAGTMGNGIALLGAQIGCDVVMRDIEDAFVERGLKGIDKFLSKSVEKGKLDAETIAVVNLSGRGDKDVSIVEKHRSLEK